MRSILWKLNRIQQIVGHQFSDVGLIRSAVTHPSAVEGKPVDASYERLEFLGDSIVGMIVADELFHEFPQLDEGGLTRRKVLLISGGTLSKVASDLGFEEVLILGPSERGTAARGLHSALENVYEAVVGALYLDAGLDAARTWVKASLRPAILAGILKAPENPKSLLQEKTQADMHETPRYELVQETGPAHMPTFVCDCIVGGAVAGTGSGPSKKEAESQAASKALESLGYVQAAAQKRG